MRRLCFDTESNYFKHPTSGVGKPADHREYFRVRGKRFEFHCAVVYDAATCRYRKFGRGQADALVDLLSTADELISHSGRRVDIIVLEHACGEARVAPLWRIPHQDLFEIHHWQSLNDLAHRFVPKLMERCERALAERKGRAATRWPEVNGFAPDKLFIAEKLAKARRDVELTYAVFEKGRRSAF